MYEARNSAIGYDTEAAMDALHADKIYLGELLCLSPEYRGCGLGTALTLQAGLRGCELKLTVIVPDLAEVFSYYCSAVAK